LQEQRPKFKPQSHQKQNKKNQKSSHDLFFFFLKKALDETQSTETVNKKEKFANKNTTVEKLVENKDFKIKKKERKNR
jgi:hypothetical protein